MTRSAAIKLAVLALCAGALSACGGGGSGGGSSASTSPGVVTVPSIESQFGTGFNTDFFASTTATPAKPMAGDIIPLSLTSPPIQLH